MPASARRRCASTASLLLWLAPLACAKNISTLPIPASGEASLTHYDFPLGAYGSCGCAINSTYLPTAALSQAAYGSASAFGPACGQCFNLTLLRTFGATPEWVLSEQQQESVVVKITDKCPASGSPGKSWCAATDKKMNKAGTSLHFDLSAPSPSIPLSWLPSNESYYGYSDFGSWIIEFEQVSCEAWAGWGNETVLGIDPTLTSEAACCPANPLVDNTTCPAHSLKSGG
ncbi:hypothetical protein JCM10207_004916 [Rhodosporidiobolus poonsookiae]